MINYFNILNKITKDKRFKSIFDKIKPIGYYNVKYKTPIKNKTIFYRRDTQMASHLEKPTVFSRPYGVKRKRCFFMNKKTVNRTRNRAITIRLTEKELENLNKKISKSKMSKQKFFEKLIDEKEILVIEDLPKLILELNRIGINLNQLTKKVNSEEKLGVFKKIDLNKDLKTNSDALKSILSTLKDIFNIN